MKRTLLTLVAFFLFGFLVSMISNNAFSQTTGEGKMNIEIKSSAFQNGKKIPSEYTCDGINISPPLTWSGVPMTAESLVLIADDPDAPGGTWIHWLVYNIPPNADSLSENIPSDEALPGGALQGTTSFQKIGYGGPCPPSGTHRYFFKIYALDIRLNLNPGANKSEIARAMEGHVLAEGHLLGLYKRG